MIRRSVEAHEKAGRWSMALYYALWLLFLPILAVAVLVNAGIDGFGVRAARKASGRCLKCGHKHEERLLMQTDAHGWKGTKTCAG